MPSPRSQAAEILGQRVRARRTELGLTLEGAAPLCDVHWSFLGQIERGQRNVNLNNLLKVAKGLSIDPGKLVRGLEPE
jgi:transcriptional regulator with XRE-family HTH domain